MFPESEIELIPFMELERLIEIKPGASVIIEGVNGVHSYAGIDVGPSGRYKRVKVRLHSGAVMSYKKSECSVLLQNFKAGF